VASDLSQRLTAGAPSRVSWLVACIGILGTVVAVATHRSAARAAAGQNWSAFVLVAGLLLIGLVAADDGLFAAAGHQLARLARRGTVLFLGAAALVGVVTAVLNLDTSVAFLTPVLVSTARSRREPDAPLLYGCLLLSNAGSLFLPGSNLTNLIVLGHLHLTGARFFATMWAPALAALLVTTATIAVFEHRSLRVNAEDLSQPQPAALGLGLAAVGAATVLVLALRSPALPVLGVGALAIGVRLAQRRERLVVVLQALGLPVLIGLFGVAIALGTLGRVWSGPATALAHLDVWGTAWVAAAGSVALNNLPAASLFAAHIPKHPFALLIGLNLGPNFFVTGSLAWFLWLRAARSVGATPSIAKASRLGVVAVPLSITAAVGVLVLQGTR
jgi:arsenical pump membrane protein